MKIILASQSPRRKELMDLLKVDYEVIVSHVDETLEKGLTIEEQSKRLGYIKAKSVFDQTQGDRIVIGSDTMVVKGQEILGKPKDKQDAIRMIQLLQNAEHQVITSLAVLIQEGESYQEYIDYDVTKVHIKKMSEEEIKKWIEKDSWQDKAGAYAIQSEFGVFVDKIDGNYFTVVGLPIHKLYDVIKSYC